MWVVSFDQKTSLSPPPINPLLSALSPPSTPTKESPPPLHSLSPPPPPILLLPPLIQPPGQSLGPLEATWPLCSWRHSVWRVWTPAPGKGLMMSGQRVRPQGCYATARNNMADLNPLRAAPVLNEFTPLQWDQGAPLRCVCRRNIWQTCALHVGVGVAWLKLKIDPENG